jgi:ribosomal protein L11 methyltransferase
VLDELERGSLLDVGCGSGVLAIAAAKLGFGPVTAVDNEEAAVEATRRNAAANGVELDCRLADAFAAELPPTDVALANISAAAVTRVLCGLDARTVVASGYLEQDRPHVDGFRHERRVARDGWAADVFRREE